MDKKEIKNKIDELKNKKNDLEQKANLIKELYHKSNYNIFKEGYKEDFNKTQKQLKSINKRIILLKPYLDD
jgi:predicted translin family RNA/ssDNA-binding protein